MYGGINMEIYIKRYKKNSLLVSILLIILSLFLIFKPAFSLNFIVIILGSIILINGIIRIISYFSNSKEISGFDIKLIQGIIYITAGLLFIFKPTIVNSFLPFIVGTWIIIESVIKLQMITNLRNVSSINPLPILIMSIITFILGIVIILNPFSTAVAITTICGIFLLVSEIINIIESVFMLKL